MSPQDVKGVKGVKKQIKKERRKKDKMCIGEALIIFNEVSEGRQVSEKQIKEAMEVIKGYVKDIIELILLVDKVL